MVTLKSLADLSAAVSGVLPSQLISEAVGAGWVDAGELRIPPGNVQPASLDLRLGESAYRIRCSFLPGEKQVQDKVKNLVVDELDLRRAGYRRTVVIPVLVDYGRVGTGADVFTRVITDYSYRFDEIAPGYHGQLYVEIVPLSFAVRVRQGLALNQLRLMVGRGGLDDGELRDMHRDGPLLFIDGRPANDNELATSGGLFLSLDLGSTAGKRVGYRAKEHTLALDMAKPGSHRTEDFWEEVLAEEEGRVVLGPERFYLLLSREAVCVPPGLACEMTAYDPTSGELRTHYAGFFDPGFGYDPARELKGSRAALEVRAHDVPFMIEHGQQVCRLTFERMICEPAKLYGTDIGSNYQGQVDTLGKHFRRPES